MKFARSERVKKLEAQKRRAEQGSTPKRQLIEDGQRKRRRSPSVSTIASGITTPGRRPQPKKVQRFDDNASQVSSSSHHSSRKS